MTADALPSLPIAVTIFSLSLLAVAGLRQWRQWRSLREMQGKIDGMRARVPSPTENTEPAPRPHGWLRRLLRRLAKPNRRLTRAEQKEINWERLAKASQKGLESRLQMEAEICAQALIGKLKQMGVRYEYKKRDGSGLSRYKLVKFMRPYTVNEEAIYLKVDLRPGHSPTGVGVKDLANPLIIPDLEVAVGHPVKTHYDAERGFIYIIERELGKRGIPNHVKFDDMLAQRPPSADGLAVPLGIGANKKVVWRSFSDMLSMLIGGSPNGGKSNIVNVMLCALIRYNSPRKLRFVLMDFKGGVEFSFYDNLPHLLPVPIDGAGHRSAIIEKREQVIPALEWLIGEGERRLTMLKEGHIKHIGQYNFANRAHPLAHIMLVIDEWADVKVEPKIGARAEELLINISNRFRAAGLHVILCTQTPTKEVVSGRIKNALQTKLAFSCSNVHSSMVLVGNYEAHNLSPQGRVVFDHLDGRAVLQTPYINNETVDATVAQAIRGEFDNAEPAAHDVTAQEIYEWSVKSNTGHLTAAEVFGKYRVRGMTQQYAEDFCRRAEGQTVMVGTTTYAVLPAAGSVPRRMVSTDQLEEEAALAALSKQKAEPLTEQGLVEWALAHNGGKLQAKAVWEAFRERGLPQKAAEALCRKVEGQTFTVAGREYRVMPAAKVAGRGTQPRRLEALNPDPAPDSALTAQPEPGPAADGAAVTDSLENTDGATADSASVELSVGLSGETITYRLEKSAIVAEPASTVEVLDP